MAEKIELTLFNPQQGHQELLRAWEWAKSMLMAGHKLNLAIKPESRSLEQNRKMWAILAEISQQVVWHGNKLSAEDWKHILTASQKQQRTVQGISGGLVVLALSTSKMTISEMSELIELAHAFGAEQGVKFNDEG